MKRVLFWSPYTCWLFHSAQEATLAHSLERRGNTVAFVSCNAVFPVCEVARETTQVRTEGTCNWCVSTARQSLESWKRPAFWLGSFLPPGLRPMTEAWVAGLPAEDILRVDWEGYPVGKWAESSTLFQFRRTAYDPSWPRMEEIARGQLLGTVLAFEGLKKVFDAFMPDVLVTFNGRFFSTRVAVEIARERGIPFLTHERGYEADTIQLTHNRTIHALENFWLMRDRWIDVPLERAQLERVDRILFQRRHGQNMGWVPFSTPPGDSAALRERLNLGDRPVVAVFNSSLDEVATFPEYCEGAFPNPQEWLPALLKMASDFPNHVFVIRIHPNALGGGVLGSSQEAVEEVEGLGRDLPANCRLVEPGSDISSYDIVDISVAGIVYLSTLGIEMACEGKPVITVAKGRYGQAGFVRLALSPAEMGEKLREALQEPFSKEGVRRAWRFLYALYTESSIPFSLVQEHVRHGGRMTYTDRSELDQGRNAILDELCRMILEGGTFRRTPTGEPSIDTTAEDAWFERRLDGIWKAGCPPLNAQ